MKDSRLLPVFKRANKKDNTLRMYKTSTDTKKENLLEYRVINPFPIYDQERTSMCLAFSFKLIKQIQEFLQTGKKFEFSAGYIYANKFSDDREGMAPLFANINLKYEGICESKYFDAKGKVEEVVSKYKQLTKEQLKIVEDNASQYTVKSHLKLEDEEDVLKYLVHYGPCMILIDVFSNFRYTSKRTGIVRKPYGSLRGGHAMVITGIVNIDGKRYYEVVNSWGTKFGLNGKCYIDVDSSIIKAIYGFVDDVPENRELRIQVGSNIVKCKNEDIKMDTPVKLIDDRMHVPVRFISEALGWNVKYIPPNKCVIDKPSKF